MVGFPRTFLSFGLGLLIAQGYRSGKLNVNIGTAALLGGITLMVGYLIFPVNEAVRAYYDLVFIFIISPFLVIIGTSKHLENRWAWLFSFLGGVSYPLYAIHAASIPLLRILALRYFKASPTILISLIDVAFLVSVSYLLDLVYDQPIRRVLMSYFRNKNSQPVSTAKTILQRDQFPISALRYQLRSRTVTRFMEAITTNSSNCACAPRLESSRSHWFVSLTTNVRSLL